MTHDQIAKDDDRPIVVSRRSLLRLVRVLDGVLYDPYKVAEALDDLRAEFDPEEIATGVLRK